MSKKLKDLQWQPVALEGFPASLSDNFQGFVGLEECTDYGLDRENKKQKKKKQQKKTKVPAETKNKIEKNQQQKRKNLPESENKVIPTKKVKLTNGFVVESCNNSVAPSQTNETSRESNKKQNNQTDKKSQQSNLKQEAVKTTEIKNKKANKLKLGEVTAQTVFGLTSEDMLTWSEYKLQEPIMRALTELGFKNPTKIQQLTLPPAIHGRRDILGAAETGSGKTLAFGLPILSGILKLKEKAAAKGLDVYDIPFKKTAAKKKNTHNEENNIKNKKGAQRNKKRNLKKINDEKEELQNKNNEIETLQRSEKEIVALKGKESSEDGYSSGDDSSSENDDEDVKVNNSSKKVKIANKKSKSDDEYLEEIEVPIKKRETSADEGNDSDEDNYIHLSDMLDSDDLADKSDEDDDTESNDDNDSDQEDDADEVINGDEAESDADETESDAHEVESDEDEVETDAESDNEVEEQSDVEIDEILGGEEGEEEIKAAGGIGCVKVIDDDEMPGHVVVKTGKPLYALILTPTRELAMQVSRHLIVAAKYTGIRVATIVGGMAAVKQERVLRSGPEIVVATPGRLWELIGQGQPHLQQLDSVKFLAIDETDRMVERGHFEELHPLLERLNIDEEKKSSRQNFVFSATLTLVHDLPTHMKGKKVTKRGKIINRKIEKMTPQQKVKRLVNMIGMTDPKVVDITKDNLGTAETLTESRISCALEHKDAYLYYILKRHPGRSLVFCNSIGCVKRLAQLFAILKCQPLPLHAGMPQRQRLKNLERFRDDPHGVLIATDVAARGLDIPGVDHVVQYQVPRTAENYVHRSGRTARAGTEGLNVLMVEPAEAYLYTKLCLTLNKTSEVPTFPVAAHTLAPLKELVVLARELDALELKKKRQAQARGWREKAAAEMDMIIDDDDVPVQAVDPTIERALKAKRRQLDSMLSQPVFPRGFSFKYPTLNDPKALSINEDNALQVMKKAMESGELKKEKRKSKNAPLLKLGTGNKNYKFRSRKSKNDKKN